MDKKKLYSEHFFMKVLNDDVSKQEQQEFDQWLLMSEQNKSEFELYKKIWDSAAYLKKYDLASAKLKTERKILEKLKKHGGFLYYWQKVAAILVIPILIASFYYYYYDNKDAISYSMTEETVKTPYGARTSFPLPDGSLIWLNSGSEISFPHNFQKVREVELKGEMYLEVKKGAKPFIVKTQYGNVKVLGTKFNVCSYDDELLITTLIEGEVAITRKNENKELILKPGFQAILKNDKYEVNRVETGTYISWKDGILEFRREPFELVAKRLERLFNVTIELKGEDIKSLWYTGTIEMESFSEVLELIKNTTPIEYSYNSKTRSLTIRKI